MGKQEDPAEGGRAPSTPAAIRTRATGFGGRYSIQLSYGGIPSVYTIQVPKTQILGSAQARGPGGEWIARARWEEKTDDVARLSARTGEGLTEAQGRSLAGCPETQHCILPLCGSGRGGDWPAVCPRNCSVSTSLVICSEMRRSPCSILAVVLPSRGISSVSL